MCRVLLSSLLIASLCVITAGHSSDSYEMVNLNDFCSDVGESKTQLHGLYETKSSAIVSARQQRLRLFNAGLCEHTVTSGEGTGLMVTIEELNLRRGFFNGTCVDYIRKPHWNHWASTFTMSTTGRERSSSHEGSADRAGSHEAGDFYTTGPLHSDTAHARLPKEPVAFKNPFASQSAAEEDAMDMEERCKEPDGNTERQQQ